MSLVLEFEFLRGTYEAGSGSDRSPSEWPPHPARVFKALTSVADSPEEFDALRWLERQSPPAVAVPDAVRCGGRQSFVPTNRLAKSKTYGDLPARTALGPVQWHAVTLRHPRLSYEWLATPDDDVVRALRELVARVPYLGRSTSPVIARVADAVDVASLTVFRPADHDLGVDLDVPYAGYLDALDAAYDADRWSSEAPRTSVRYSASVDDVVPDTASGPYGEMIVIGFDGRRVAPIYAVAVAARVREAIQHHIDGGPVVLRGVPPRHRRGAGDVAVPRHQIAFTALPFVDHAHASGLLLGVAAVLPRSIDGDDRRAVLRGLAAVVRGGLALGRLGRLGLDASIQPQQTLSLRRWRGPSRQWVSALPISANRHHREVTPEVLITEVERSCTDLDLPPPAAVQVSRGPLLSGAVTIPGRHRVRHPGDRSTASFHAALTFDEPVAGPLLLGSMRRYGLGLMLPMREEST